MKARYNTHCVLCSNPISVGDEITKNEVSNSWVHDECPNEQQNEENDAFPLEMKGLKLDPEASYNECGMCRRLLPTKGNKYWDNNKEVCGACFDQDIKMRWGFDF